MIEGDTVTDRVVAVEVEHQDEVDLRLADHTPSGAYTALVDEADQLGLDLTEYSDMDTVAIAEVNVKTGEVVEFKTAGGEWYADVEVCFEGQIRLPVLEGAEHREPTEEEWRNEVKEVISEEVFGVYFNTHTFDMEIGEVFQD